MRLTPNETELVGKWIEKEGRVVADDTCNRIGDLVKNHLTKIGNDLIGWDTLYRDSADGRLGS